RNHIPRKSLNYQTPLEVFLSYVNGKGSVNNFV
ncbi:IS30 family transposase, partial [Enterococcus faecium]